MKATHASLVKKFTDIPNIGPAMQKDFEILGIKEPADLANMDPFKMYKNIYKKTGTRHDPCVLDTYMAAVDFMQGGKPVPWWHFTAKRKKTHPEI